MWPPALAERLRERGHDVVAVLERDDLVSRSDEAVLETARGEERAVFTEDVHGFISLAKACIQAEQRFYGLILTSDEAYPRGHPRTLGRVTRALDRYLTERPAIDALLNRLEWLTSVR